MELDERIYRRIVSSQAIPLDVVRKAVRSQFKQARNTIRKNDYTSYSMQYLGEFSVKPARLFKMIENNNCYLYEGGEEVLELYRKKLKVK